MIEEEHSYAHHEATHPVREVFHGQVIWEGEVEEFRLTANHHAKVCYGWAAKDDVGKEEITDAVIQFISAPPFVWCDNPDA